MDNGRARAAAMKAMLELDLEVVVENNCSLRECARVCQGLTNCARLPLPVEPIKPETSIALVGALIVLALTIIFVMLLYEGVRTP